MQRCKAIHKPTPQCTSAPALAPTLHCTDRQVRGGDGDAPISAPRPVNRAGGGDDGALAHAAAMARYNVPGVCRDMRVSLCCCLRKLPKEGASLVNSAQRNPCLGLPTACYSRHVLDSAHAYIRAYAPDIHGAAFVLELMLYLHANKSCCPRSFELHPTPDPRHHPWFYGKSAVFRRAAGFAGLSGIGHGAMGGPPQYGQPSLAGLTSSGVNPFEGLAAQPFMGPGGHAGGDGVADGAGVSARPLSRRLACEVEELRWQLEWRYRHTIRV